MEILVNLTQIDNEATALALQLEELDAQLGRGKGKYTAGHPPDSEVALTLFKRDLQDYERSLNDLKFAHSVARAVLLDGKTIAAVEQENFQIEEDRKVALRLADCDEEIDSSTPYSTQDDIDAPDDLSECVKQSAEADLALAEQLEEDEAGPSSAYVCRQEIAFQKTARCGVCLDKHSPFDVLRFECGDTYCKSCLKDLFLRSTKDESLYPPKCCKKPIPLAIIQSSMTQKEAETFRLAEIEFATINRIYCSNPQCRRFILPERTQGDYAICGYCDSRTCVHCKSASHDGDCAEDPAIQATLALANSLGWRRCPRCARLLELNRGCYHMTCRCKAEFCYLCGVKWKGCTCATWNEENLVDRAEEIVDREAPLILPRAERARRVQEVRQEILETHECEHSRRFERIFDGPRRGFRCEICDHRHWKYILQCRLCHLRVCEDCRRNRV